VFLRSMAPAIRGFRDDCAKFAAPEVAFPAAADIHKIGEQQAARLTPNT
jgi:hypothetical protein